MRLLIVFSIATCCFAANAVYLAPSSAGGNTGVDCSNAKAYTYFNTAGNWSATPTGIQIGPDTTVHLCSGTYTATVNTTLLTFQGSGSSGHVVTLTFDSGATLTSPAWSAQGAIDLGGQAFLLIDGGTNGTVTATANGSGLANQLNSMGIKITSSHDIEIRNLTITNLYQHTSTTDVTPDPTVTGCVYANGFGNNISIHNNTFTDGPWCVNLQFSGTSSGVQIYNNNIGRVPHGIALGGSASGHLSNVTIYGNTIHDFGNWGTTADTYHLTGIHIYGASGTTTVPTVSIYNNIFNGTWGNAACPGSTGGCITGFVFIEGGTSRSGISGLSFFNNVGVSDAPINNGLFGIFDGNSDQVYNNTMVGSTTSDGVCFAANQSLTGFNFRNNLMTTCSQLISIQTLSFNAAAPNYDLYGNGGSNAFVCGTNFYTFAQFSSWQSCIASAGDANSSTAANALLNSNGTLQSGSPAIGSAVNLTSLGITPLDSDAAGIARPSSGAWDIGAYQYASGAIGSTWGGNLSISGNVSR